MPLSSQNHVPKLMGEDEHSIRYGCDAEEYAEEGQEKKEVEGVFVTFGNRKADGARGVVSCEFKKPQFDKDKAGAWLAAQKFAIEPADLHSVSGVEIFSTGLWNGKQITDHDLDCIVAAFGSTKGMVRPSLKLGHDDEQKLLQKDGLPAAGWVENVRKVGSKLVADFVDIPKKVYQLIANKAYRKVSCEIYNNVDIKGSKYPKMLGAVALLGADLPGVLNLDDILSLYGIAPRFAGIEKFAAGSPDPISLIQHKGEGNTMPAENQDQFKAQLDQKDAEITAAKAAAAAKDAEIEKFKKEADDAKKAAAELAEKAQAATVDAFVTGLQADKLCSPAMAPLVKELFAKEKETYAIGDKQVPKADLVKELLKLAHANAKVNFAQETKDESTEGQPTLDGEIEKYAKENKVDYVAAYKAVTRGKKLDAKPMYQEERA